MVPESGETPDEKRHLEEILARFKRGGWDTERHVSQLEKLKATVVGTTLYIPAATKGDMDRSYGRPVTAIHTLTVKEEGRMYFRAVDSTVPDCKPINLTKTMGAGSVAIGVQLRKLQVPVSRGRTFELDVAYMDDPDGGRLYWIEFKGFENKPAQVDTEVAAARKEVEDALKKAKKAEKLRKIRSKLPPSDADTASGSNA
jgi:hypothetical protein